MKKQLQFWPVLLLLLSFLSAGSAVAYPCESLLKKSGVLWINWATRGIEKKIAPRTLESLIEENGTRLNYANLNLGLEDIGHLYNRMKAKGLITNQIKTFRIAYNPLLTTMGLAPLFKDLAHITQLTEIDLRGIYVSSKSLELISNYHPNIEKVRMGFFNGRALSAFDNNYRLKVLDISEAQINRSEVSTRDDEALKRPYVSVSDLKFFIKNRHKYLKKVLLPPIFPPEHEDVFLVAQKLGVELVQVPSHLVVTFDEAERLNNKGGLSLKLKGEPTNIYFPSFIFPRNSDSAAIAELVVAHHLNLFLKNLAEEGLKGELVAPIKMADGSYHSDILIRRKVNGVLQSFLLSNLLGQMRLIAPTPVAWNQHTAQAPATWQRLIRLHSELQERQAFNGIGPIK